MRAIKKPVYTFKCGCVSEGYAEMEGQQTIFRKSYKSKVSPHKEYTTKTPRVYCRSCADTARKTSSPGGGLVNLMEAR